jgi:hypothetical protein
MWQAISSAPIDREELAVIDGDGYMLSHFRSVRVLIAWGTDADRHTKLH